MNPWFFLIHLTFGLISWILYFLVNQYIYHHRKQFHSAFTRVWSTFTIVNLLQFIAMKLYFQIPMHTPADSYLGHQLTNFPYQLPLTILYFLAYYFVHCQRICVLLIMALSFRLIVFPFSSSPFWERKYYITASLIFGIPIPFVYHVIYSEPVFNYFPDLDGFILCPSILTSYHIMVKTVLQSNFFEITTAIISGVLKMSSLFFLSTSSVRKRDDRNLYVVTTALFFTCIVKFSCAILMILNLNRHVEMVVLYLYPMTADLVALSCPYVLLYINSKMRRHILRCKWLTKLRTKNSETEKITNL